MRIQMLNIVNNSKNIYLQLSQSIKRLSSGKRVNSPTDDPAGFAISERMKAQIRGLNQASRNAQDAISMVQTAESGMGQMVDALQRMRELYVYASNGTLTDEDRQKIGYEIDELKGVLSDIRNHTEFNSMGLLNGSHNNGQFDFQIGANQGDTTSLKIDDLDLSYLGLDGLVDINDEDLDKNIGLVDKALGLVSSKRSMMGARQSGLEATIKRLDIQAENLQAAESRITDLDIAKEMMNYARLQMLAQVNQFLMIHAKSDAEMVLELLK